MQTIDNMRSQGIVDPVKFLGDIHIVGVGATGSLVVDQLIRLGFGGNQIHIYDFDIVEEHNINNQLYCLEDIGKPKVQALKDTIRSRYNQIVHAHEVEVKSSDKLEGVVFVLTDTFSSRAAIMDSVFCDFNTKAIFETGLDARCFYTRTLNPCNTTHVNKFRESLGNDDDPSGAEVSACGTRQVVFPTVSIVASAIVWEFIKWINGKELGSYFWMSLDPYHTIEESL